MLVCADGAPFLLGLPAALARLGWAGGLAVLLAGFLCILHAATRVVMLHEHGGHRRKSLRELAQSVYGGCRRGAPGCRAAGVERRVALWSLSAGEPPGVPAGAA